MPWSFRIGRLFGIDVYVHATFFLLPAWLAMYHYGRTKGDTRAVVLEVLFVMVVFGIIVLHELGHALAARRYGVQTRDITLLPIGGVARLERIPDNPYQEFVVAVAGPAVNVALAVIFFILALAMHGLGGLLAAPFEGPWLSRLFALNVGLVVFNMIPAFPMDGGRVLRSVLAMGMDYVRATRIAAGVGQSFAFLVGLLGFMSMQPFLMLIALFVWIGASQEASMVATRAALAGIPVRYAMISDFRVVRPEDSLEAVAHHILSGFQHDFPVVDDGRVVGIITRTDLVKALAEIGRQALVGDVMQREFVTVHPDEPLTEAFHKLQACDCHSMPVMKDSQIVGLLTAENVGEFLMISDAVRQQAGRAGKPLAGRLPA